MSEAQKEQPNTIVLDAEHARLERNVRDLVRWRLIFFVLLLVVPTGLYALFERQARRLDALGDHGSIAIATVTSVSHREGSSAYISYEYTIGNVTHIGSADHNDAPFNRGQTFSVLYLPENPSFNQPGNDRTRAIAKAASNRGFSSKVVAGFAAFFAVCAFACDFNLRRLRVRGLAELNDPHAYRMRLVFAAMMLLPFFILIFGWHLKDTVRHQESSWPVVLGALLSLAILGGTTFYVLRHGQAQAAARSVRLIKWVTPIAVGVGALRLLAWLLGWY